MDLGPVTGLPGLNSFYDRPQDREPNMQKLTRFLEARPRTGPLTILVTHFVTIAELVGMGTSSGEGVLLKLKTAASAWWGASRSTANWSVICRVAVSG